jgi:hypothetical protein
MKKLVFILFAFTVVSCGKSGVEADAEKICDFMDQTVKAYEAKDIDKLRDIQMDLLEYRKELIKKYENDNESVKQLEEKTKECQERVSSLMK